MHSIKDTFDKEEFTPEELRGLDEFVQVSVDGLNKSTNESKGDQKKPLELESPAIVLTILSYFSLVFLASVWIMGFSENATLFFLFGSCVPVAVVTLYLKLRSTRMQIKQISNNLLRSAAVSILRIGPVLFNVAFSGILLIGFFLIYRSMQDLVYSIGLIPVLLLMIIFLQAELIQDNFRKE